MIIITLKDWKRISKPYLSLDNDIVISNTFRSPVQRFCTCRNTFAPHFLSPFKPFLPYRRPVCDSSASSKASETAEHTRQSASLIAPWSWPYSRAPVAVGPRTSTAKLGPARGSSLQVRQSAFMLRAVELTRSSWWTGRWERATNSLSGHSMGTNVCLVMNLEIWRVAWFFDCVEFFCVLSIPVCEVNVLSSQTFRDDCGSCSVV